MVLGDVKEWQTRYRNAEVGSHSTGPSGNTNKNATRNILAGAWIYKRRRLVLQSPARDAVLAYQTIRHQDEIPHVKPKP